jgi:hypothetical protein
MQTRGFTDFIVHHFIYYNFRDYKAEFLLPILQERHECKLQGKQVEAEILKLIANGNFGYNAIQSTNYSTTKIIHEAGYNKSTATWRRPENMQSISVIGVIDLNLRTRASKIKKKGLETVLAEEAEEEEESKAKPKKPKYQLLLSVMISGQTKYIRNTIAQAVSTLSNSKMVILRSVHAILVCLDPRLFEICYMDTDSCLISTTFPRIEQCVLPHKLELWRQLDILADETSPHSCHGKMKLEGVYCHAYFKGIKIYRLLNEWKDDGSEGGSAHSDSVYTRCKGVSMARARTMTNAVFTDNTKPVVTQRHGLGGAHTYEITLFYETKQLAMPFNLKRFQIDNVHTAPIGVVLPSKFKLQHEGENIVVVGQN